MAFELGDIFIGQFPITQSFGARPEVYAARYNLRGHNGVDFGCPTMTPVLSAADGIVTELGFDSGGYGNYIKITHPGGFLTLYGHLNDIQIKQNDKVVSGQLIGHSNNTGFSDAPHLHFGVAPCDGGGIKTDAQNGYSGYIDPNGAECHWNVKNLSAPVVPGQAEAKPPIPVPFDDFAPMVSQGSNYKQIAAWAVANGINDFLSVNNMAPLDMQGNPADPSGGNKITAWLGALLQAVHNPPLPNPEQLNDTQRTSLLKKILGRFFNFT